MTYRDDPDMRAHDWDPNHETEEAMNEDEFYCYSCERTRNRDTDGFNDDPPICDDEPMCNECFDLYTERAWERMLSDYYGGDGPRGCYDGETAREMAEARKLK